MRLLHQYREQAQADLGRRRMRGQRAAAVTLAVASVVGLRWYAATRNPVCPAGFGPSAAPARGERVMDGPNAAHFYAAAADALPAQLEDSKLDTLSVAEQKAEVTRAAESLALVRQGFAYRYQGPGRTAWMKTEPAQGLSAPVPNYANLRKVARLLAADARVKAAAGDTAGALSSSLDAVRFGQDIGSRGNALIEGMIGTLIEGIGETEALKNVHGLSAAEARSAARRVEGLLDHEVTFGQIVASERRFGYAALDELFRDSSGKLGVEALDLNVSGTLDRIKMNAVVGALLLWYGKQGIVDDYTRAGEELTRRAALPYQQAKALGAPPEPRNWVVRMMTPHAQRAHLSRVRATMRQRVLAARLAVEAYRAEHGGSAPATLDELTHGPDPYLSVVPADPFSPDGTAPLRYRNGNAYSVGDNGADDGGTGDDDPLHIPSR
jgi:hypothetical protein